MLIPFGVLSAAGAEVGAEPAYELIASEILGSAQASVTFSSLGDYSSTYKHLQIRAAVRGSLLDNIILRINSDTGSNYKSHILFGDGSSVGSDVYANTDKIYLGNASSTANQFVGLVLDVLDPYSTTKNTTTRTMYGNAGSPNVVQLLSGLWINTASITTLQILHDSGNLETGSRFSLYGIKG